MSITQTTAPQKDIHTKSGAAMKSAQQITQHYSPGSPWKGWGYYTRTYFLSEIKKPVNMLFFILLPIGLYMMFGTGKDYSNHSNGYSTVSASILVNMSFYGVLLASSAQAVNISLEKNNGVRRLLALTPLSSLAQIVSHIVAFFGLAALIAICTLGVGAATGAKMEMQAWILVLPLMLILSLPIIAMGLFFGYRMDSSGAQGASSGALFFFCFLSDMFMPVDQMGTFFQKLAVWMPLHGAAKMLALPLNGWHGFRMEYIANFIIWSVVFIWLAWKASKRETSR